MSNFVISDDGNVTLTAPTRKPRKLQKVAVLRDGQLVKAKRITRFDAIQHFREASRLKFRLMKLA